MSNPDNSVPIVSKFFKDNLQRHIEKVRPKNQDPDYLSGTRDPELSR